MNKWSWLLLVIAFGIPAYGQSAVLLGMTNTEVDQLLGSPTRFYDAGLQTFTQFFPVVSRGPVWECHKRITKIQEYEVRIGYSLDESTSRLHPVRRVSEIWILFDHPLNLQGTFSDSPEIRKICAVGCHMQVYQFKSLFGRPENPVLPRLFDHGRTVMIILEYYDQTREQKSIAHPDDPVSEIRIEKYFSLEQYSNMYNIMDSGEMSSANWAPM
jgi:hypothetical protein